MGVSARAPTATTSREKDWGNGQAPHRSYREAWAAGPPPAGPSTSPQQGKGVRDGGACWLRGPNLLTRQRAALGQLDPNWGQSFLFRSGSSGMSSCLPEGASCSAAWSGSPDGQEGRLLFSSHFQRDMIFLRSDGPGRRGPAVGQEDEEPLRWSHLSLWPAPAALIPGGEVGMPLTTAALP